MKCDTGPLYEGVRNSYSFIWGMWSQQRRQVEFAKAIVERVLDTPNDGVRYMGFVPAQNMKDVTASIRHKVYQQWDASSESPPQSRPAETTETTAPPLQVLAFQNGRPVFPNSLLSRFDADSREHQQILEKKVELELLFPPPAAGDPVATAGWPCIRKLRLFRGQWLAATRSSKRCFIGDSDRGPVHRRQAVSACCSNFMLDNFCKVRDFIVCASHGSIFKVMSV